MLKVSDNLVKVSTMAGTYAYNSVFGGLTKLSAEDIMLLNDGFIEDDSPKTERFQKLVDKRFIVSEYDSDEAALTRLVEKYRAKIISGESITKLLLMVTDRCMLNCKYCYIPDAPGHNTSVKHMDMDWATAKNAIDVFREIINQNGRRDIHIRFHGGEPILNFSVIKKAILYVEDLFLDCNVSFHTNSNGVVINDEIAKFLSAHNVHVEISMDGVDSVHNMTRCYANGAGSFHQAMGAIHLLKKYNSNLKNVNLAVTLNRMNYNHLIPLVDLAVQEGLKEIEINTLLFEHPLDILDDIEARVRCLIDVRKYGVEKGVRVSGKWLKLFERLKKPVLNYCGRMGQQLGVDCNGNVFLCTGYMKTFGRINQWKDILQSEEYLSICMRVLGRITSCKGCPIQGLCAGGCTASVVKEYGSIEACEEKECKFRQAMIAALIQNIHLISSAEVPIEDVDGSYYPVLSDMENM